MSTKAVSVACQRKAAGTTHYTPKRYKSKSVIITAVTDVIIRVTLTILVMIFVANCITDVPAYRSPEEMARRLENSIVSTTTMKTIHPRVIAKPLAAPQIIDDESEPVLPPDELYEESEPVLPPAEIIVEPEIILPTPMELMNAGLGNDVIDIGIGSLTRYDLPSKFYPGIDFSTFQPWMSYKVIKDKSSAAYKVISDPRMYIDDNGLCRFEVDPETQFTIDGQDDFVIALGTFYKPKGTCGDRWLIVTTTGMYTAITGDEKDDSHTDDHNMFSSHGNYAGMIEWLVDTPKLEKTAKCMGSVTYVPSIEAVHGDILYMYRIE